MEDLSPVLAQRLKSLRESQGLTLAGLSKVLTEKYGIQISKESLTNYEVVDSFHSKARKNEGMSVKYLRCLADFYGVTTDYLLGRTETKTTKEDIQAAHKTTGLSESAIKALHDLHNAPFEGVALNRNGITYEISYITLLSKLLEMDEDFRQIFQQLAYFMLYSEALPEQAYETRKIKLSSDESEHFRIWIESNKWELIPNDEARELHLQSAGEKFKAIYRKILENETVKGDGRQWQALKKR